jgi:hypothetical protein
VFPQVLEGWSPAQVRRWAQAVLELPAEEAKKLETAGWAGWFLANADSQQVRGLGLPNNWAQVLLSAVSVQDLDWADS